MLSIEDFWRFVDAFRSTTLLASVSIALSQEQADAVAVFEKTLSLGGKPGTRGT